MDDSGTVDCVLDAKKLLEDIPNKVLDIIGIILDVDLHKTENGDYIEIKIDPYSNGVNYKYYNLT